MKIDKRFEIPFICLVGAVPRSKVWKKWRRPTEVKACSNPCLSLSTPAEEIKEIISGAAASQLLDPDPFSSPSSGWRISSFFDFGIVVEADCWPLLTFAYDLPRNGLLGVCSSDREADEKIRLNLYINISIIFAGSMQLLWHYFYWHIAPSRIGWEKRKVLKV